MLDHIANEARKHKGRIILPEQDDPRITVAASILVEHALATPVFLRPTSMEVDGAEIFCEQADTEQWRRRAAHTYCQLRRNANITYEKALIAMEDPLILAAMLVKLGYVDGGIAGSVASSSSVLKAGLQCIEQHRESQLVSSVFLMAWPDRMLTFGDCAVNPRPEPEQLAKIAIDSALTHQRLTGKQPRVAFLSFSTHGSANHPEIDRIRNAVTIARKQAPTLPICGELQADAALVPAIAKAKAGESAVAGRANVLIFPDLNAGNIGYKLTERLAGARAIGPVIQGFAKPWMDLSRGCSVDDIVQLAAISSCLAGSH